MASSRRVRTALFLLFLTCDTTGVSGRAVRTRGFPSRPGAQTLRADEDAERCAELVAPWQENARPAPEEDNDATRLQLRVRPFSPGASRGLLFPGKSLFSFVRRVYRCCQERLGCRSVKGLQGRLRGGTQVEFLLTRESLSFPVMRAELHLQLSNPQHLDIHPVLSAAAKRGLPTRYSAWSRGSAVELRVDLLFLLQVLQEEAAGGAGGEPSSGNIRRVVFSGGEPPRERDAPEALQDTDGDAWGDGEAGTPPALEVGLVLGCSQAGSGVSCGGGGVHLSHTPFMAVYYR